VGNRLRTVFFLFALPVLAILLSPGTVAVFFSPAALADEPSAAAAGSKPADLNAAGPGESARPVMNKFFIAAPAPGRDRSDWLSKLHNFRLSTLAANSLDGSLYDREDLRWVTGDYACCFAFMYDRSFYDPDKGQYTIDSFLDDGQAEFGGYDMVLLWQGYPRMGVDRRNQFDFYRDMPGGLAAVRDIVDRLHRRGVKAAVCYNPWDVGSRREDKSDEQALAELVSAIDADAIFLDTMPAAPAPLRQAIDKVRPGVAFIPEIYPPLGQLKVCSASWAQEFEQLPRPGMLRLKWLEPRHIQYQIRRWERSHQTEIETAFFNGSGIMIWENVFGTYNPWSAQGRFVWRRAEPILRRFAVNFSSDRWDPFYPTSVEGLYAHRWPGEKATVFTLLNTGRPLTDAALLDVPAGEGMAYYDLWNGRQISVEPNGQTVTLAGSITRLGCILAVKNDSADKSLADLLAAQRRLADRDVPVVDGRNSAKSLIEPRPVGKTKLVPSNRPPAGMVFVPGGMFRMRIQHRPRECGCYPDPGTSKDKWPDFLFGWQMKGIHDFNVNLAPFFIDETEVTNAQFKKFLDATGYHPKNPENFLKHWPGGQMSEDAADNPVVYVDIDDARAYAGWASKRLPDEPEWQLAAQGTDGRTWPWGNQFDPNKCNTTGDRTVPVKSFPQGTSPYGCYNMAGNVWEWTESFRDDGHTRFVMIRGGSYFNAKGSDWYVEGGPQPCNHHAKFVLMWPGLDRCATIGFRCVVDAAH